jgi:PIF1-like helicase
MVFVPPNAGDRFYLRLLLSVVTGARSFNDLKSFHGVIHPSYREACLARGLLADDNELKRTLEDGKYMQTGRKLRQLFVTIVRDCQPSKPTELWELFKVDLCDDLLRFLNRQRVRIPTNVTIFDYGLHLIQARLRRDDKSMGSVGLPDPCFPWDNLLSPTHHPHSLAAHAVTFDREEQEQLLNESLPRLNHEQTLAFTTVLDAALARSPVTFFMQGAGGAGKTFVYITLCFAARSRGLLVLSMASSGIAALLLPGGRTAHSTLKIPISIDQSSTCTISKRSALANVLKDVRLIIWDECSMQHRFAFEAVNRTLQDIRDNKSLFGGITTILGGDFLQTLPVVTYGSKYD